MNDNQEILVSFGQAVQELRIERGLSQEGLAAVVGMHRTYISDVERGARNTSLMNAEKIAAGLNVRLSDLIKIAEAEIEEI